MTPSVFIVLCVFIVTICADLQCGPKETATDCPTECESDDCPKNEYYKWNCSAPKRCPPASCKCIFNYSRDINGTCIPTRDCPPFPCERPNEEFVPCPSYCPTDDCSQATADGNCPLGPLLIVVSCRPACRCKKGYWRKEGVCVPYEECPQNEKIELPELLSPIFVVQKP